MRQIRKPSLILLAMILSTGLLLPISACQSDSANGSGTLVGENDPFFSSLERVLYMPGEDTSISELSNIRVTGDAILVSVMYAPKISKDASDEEAVMPVEETIIYSFANNTVKPLDMKSMLRFDASMCMSVALRPDGYAEAMYAVFDESAGEMFNQWFVVDLSTGSVVSEVNYDIRDTLPDPCTAFEIDDKGNRYFVSGSKLSAYGESGDLLLAIEDEGLTGTLRNADGKVFTGKESDRSIGEYNLVNLEKGSLEAVEQDFLASEVLSLDGSTYVADGEKLVAGDTGETVFSWLDTDANLSHYLQQTQYVVRDRDTIYAIGIVEKADQVSAYCSLLTRAEKNIHAGKSILYLGGINILSDPDLMAAVYEFNLFSEKAYMRLNNFPYDPEKENEDYDQVIQQLYQAVRDGNKVDIVMNTGSYMWFSDQDALLDLSDMLGSEIKGDAFFPKIPDAFCEGDKLYQIPGSRQSMQNTYSRSGFIF